MPVLTAGNVERWRVTAPGSAFSAGTSSRIGVDRKNGVIHGYVVMMAGQLKDRPGEVDGATLDGIVALGNAAARGVRSHFTHGGLCEDQLGSYLGRAHRFRLATARTEQGREVPAVRADLHFDPTALDTPPKGGGKPLGLYVMDLATTDPDAISSSVVARFKREYRLNADGTRVKDAKTGEELPPLMRPLALHGSDIVAQGAAVDGLLSVGGLRDGELWQAEAAATRLLEGPFARLSRREIRERLTAWLDRTLDEHFGTTTAGDFNSPAAIRERRMRLHEYAVMEDEHRGHR